MLNKKKILQMCPVKAPSQMATVTVFFYLSMITRAVLEQGETMREQGADLRLSRRSAA